jgi:hypothetical protein
MYLQESGEENEGRDAHLRWAHGPHGWSIYDQHSRGESNHGAAAARGPRPNDDQPAWHLLVAHEHKRGDAAAVRLGPGVVDVAAGRRWEREAERSLFGFGNWVTT